MALDAIGEERFADAIRLEGARKSRRNTTRQRIRLISLALFCVFAAVAVKLLMLGNVTVDTRIEGQERDKVTATRPAILDRNGIEMGMDVRVPSLIAEPRNVIDVEEAVAKLMPELPGVNPDWLRDKLTGDKGFVWIQRELTPAQQERIWRLGLPGIVFLTESRRFYPAGPEAAHIVGTVNLDNQGIAGLERHMDIEDVALLQELGLARGRELQPERLSIDMRVQHAMREQLVDALERYQAIAAAGVIVDVRTGEILAMSSLPDFDPNDPVTSQVKGAINRITAERYELGSTFKTITFAAALEAGAISLTDQFDARYALRFGRYTIDDFHGKHAILSVPEIFKYSSNIGTIKIMQALGKDRFRTFMSQIALDEPLKVELPETTESRISDEFKELEAATAAFGHGLSVTPLHLASAYAALVNDGQYVPATLYPRTQSQADELSRRVVSSETSRSIRYLLRLNALEGSGTRAKKFSEGYRIGGKTGTAEKVVDGRYSSEKSLAIFASVFPVDAPRYAMVILVDEPRNENEQSGRTAGWNAGEVSGRIVARIAPILGIEPDLSSEIDLEIVPPVLRTHSEPVDL